jgi:hypothetical protein
VHVNNPGGVVPSRAKKIYILVAVGALIVVPSHQHKPVILAAVAHVIIEMA